jgi:hypothetical protein
MFLGFSWFKRIRFLTGFLLAAFLYVVQTFWTLAHLV